MFSADTKFRLVHALANQELADDLERRLENSLTSDAEEAQEFLASFTHSTETHREWATAATCLAEAGDELADRLELAEAILEAKADGDETEDTPAVAATFTGQVLGMTTDITIDADTAGAAGNDILLEFDGIIDIDAAIAAWNLANPENTATLSDGDGSQIPDNLETIQLADGEDATYTDENIAPAIAAFGTQSLSDAFMERLVIAMASEEAAAEFKEKFDEFVENMND